MKSHLMLLLAAGLTFHCQELPAQVPSIINYQGRVTVNGQTFDGSGQFKFALVNRGGTTTFWSNDGTITPGVAPTTVVTLIVSKGQFSVPLGGAEMQSIPASVFGNPEVYLRVWFNDGTAGFQMLTPDQRIGAVGYAIMAGNVPDGTITARKLAARAVTRASIGPGAIGSNQLAEGTVRSNKLAVGAAAANLQATGKSAVTSGGVILSPDSNASALLNSGYVKIGQAVIGTPGQRMYFYLRP